jgi:hypothetical protein
MEQAAGRHAAGGQHRAGSTLPRRPEDGAAAASAHLERRGPHRAGPAAVPWVTDAGLLRRVLRALASGARP